MIAMPHWLRDRSRMTAESADDGVSSHPRILILSAYLGLGPYPFSAAI